MENVQLLRLLSSTSEAVQRTFHGGAVEANEMAVEHQKTCKAYAYRYSNAELDQ